MAYALRQSCYVHAHHAATVTGHGATERQLLRIADPAGVPQRAGAVRRLQGPHHPRRHGQVQLVHVRAVGDQE